MRFCSTELHVRVSLGVLQIPEPRLLAINKPQNKGSNERNSIAKAGFLAGKRAEKSRQLLGKLWDYVDMAAGKSSEKKYCPKWGPLHFSDIEAPLCVRSTCGHCMSTEPGTVPEQMTWCMSVAWANSGCSAVACPWTLVVRRNCSNTSGFPQLWAGMPTGGAELYPLEQQTGKGFAGECKGL